MLTILLGIASSLATESVTWLNARLSGTVLKGDGAFLLAGTIALIISTAKFFLAGGSLSDWATDFSTIWASSQVFFLAVMQTLNLDVPSTT